MSTLTLRQQLESARKRNATNNLFIPEETFRALLTNENITKSIQGINENLLEVDKKAQCVSSVLEGGHRTYAILVLISCESLVYKLIEHDMTFIRSLDARLPWKEEDLTPVFSGSTNAAQLFFIRQWELLAPIFKRGMIHNVFPNTIHLPFLREEDLGGGGFGDVFKVELPVQHQGIQAVQSQTLWVVKKTIKIEDQGEHSSSASDQLLSSASERRILELLRSLSHPNIVELIASFSVLTQNRDDTWSYKHHMLFPLANQGSLHQLLREKPVTDLPEIFPSFRKLFEQLYGIASAIEKLHNFELPGFNLKLIGCHRDLRPKNILVHEGRLLLADFGLSRLRPENSKSKFLMGDGDYLAPECQTLDEDEFKAGTINRASDIWGLGCVMLDLITYLSDRRNGRKVWNEFRDSRKRKFLSYTVRLFHEHDAPMPQVERQLEHLRSILSGTEGEILNLIEVMLRINPKRRPKATEITSNMFMLCQKIVFETLEHAIKPFTENSEGDFLPWQIEKDRLELWGFHAGLSHKSHGFQGISWLANSPQHFTKTGQTLSCLSEELSQLSLESKNMIHLNSLPIRIREMNDVLWYMVPSEELRLMTSALENRLIQVEDREKLVAIKKVFKSNPPHKNISTLAAMKNLKTKLDAQPSDDWRQKLYHSTVLHTTLKGLHYFGKLPSEHGEEHVMVEYMSYNLEYYKRGHTESEEILERVEKLAALLDAASDHEQFRTLELHGYFHDIARAAFGITFYLPNQVSKPATTMKDIITKSTRPALGMLFVLSYKLVFAILQFHKVNDWVHKSISAHNIVFFDDELYRTIVKPPKNAEDETLVTPMLIEPREYLEPSSIDANRKTKSLSRMKNPFSRMKSKSNLKSSASSSVTSLQGQLGSKKASAHIDNNNRSNPSPQLSPSPLPSKLAVLRESDLESPYLVGFNHSRQDDKGAFTSGASLDVTQRLYHHPDYNVSKNGARFKLHYDYYSLGLILLEIGLWKSLEELEEDAASYQPSALRTRLLASHVHGLGPAMGKTYENVVRLCLGDGDVVLDREVFEKDVVSKLFTCSA